MNPDPDTQESGAAGQESEASEVEIADGATVGELLAHLGADPDELEMVLVNGEEREHAAALRDGDAVALTGRMGGM